MRGQVASMLLVEGEPCCVLRISDIVLRNPANPAQGFLLEVVEGLGILLDGQGRGSDGGGGDILLQVGLEELMLVLAGGLED